MKPERRAPLEAEGFILAGGGSTRMGRDKALLRFRGIALVETALEKLRAIAPAPRIAGSRPDLSSIAPCVADLHPGCGPLAGIEAALTASRAEWNVFLPVDVPLLPAAFLAWMLERAERTGALATIPLALGKAQPLTAVYRRSLLPGIARAIAGGRFKTIDAIESAAAARGIDCFHIETLAAAGQFEFAAAEANPAAWFLNMNSPQDLALPTRRV